MVALLRKQSGHVQIRAVGQSHVFHSPGKLAHFVYNHLKLERRTNFNG